MQGPFLRKYGVSTTIYFAVYEVDGVNMRKDAVIAVGDIFLSKDGGTETAASNAATDEGRTYSLVLDTDELECAVLSIALEDQSGTKVFLDDTIIVETYGHASAEHAFDLDVSLQGVNVTQISGSATAADNLEETTESVVTGTASGTPTTSQMNTSLTLADDIINGRAIIIKGGTGSQQFAIVEDYQNTSGVIVFDRTLAVAPVASDPFVVV